MKKTLKHTIVKIDKLSWLVSYLNSWRAGNVSKHCKVKHSNIVMSYNNYSVSLSSIKSIQKDVWSFLFSSKMLHNTTLSYMTHIEEEYDNVFFIFYLPYYTDIVICRKRLVKDISDLEATNIYMPVNAISHDYVLFGIDTFNDLINKNKLLLKI